MPDDHLRPDSWTADGYEKNAIVLNMSVNNDNRGDRAWVINMRVT